MVKSGMCKSIFKIGTPVNSEQIKKKQLVPVGVCLDMKPPSHNSFHLKQK